MIYNRKLHKDFVKQPHYRTITSTGRILEVWKFLVDVKPIEDYHKIQYLSGGKVIAEWYSMKDLQEKPF